jgi:LysR family nod box-dependent transcriptional activator
MAARPLPHSADAAPTPGHPWTGAAPAGIRRGARACSVTILYYGQSGDAERMQLNRFDLNLLISLDVLLHEKNVTRAAERVHVSQPAMSAALHKLREYFNDQLLVRVGREMELTPRGLSLVEPVREALLSIQATLGTQPSFDPKTAQREFTIIVSEEAVPGFLPAILRRLAGEAPGIRCRIELI